MRNTPMPLPKKALKRDGKGHFLTPDVQDEIRLLIRRMKAESGETWRRTAKRLAMTESFLSVLASDNSAVHARHPITPQIMIRVAFAMNVSIDVLLGRRFDPDGDCIACSAPPDWRKCIVMKMR